MENNNEDVKENCDSIEIGSPTKEGKLKVYFNSDDVEGAKKKVDNAKEIREYANTNVAVNI